MNKLLDILKNSKPYEDILELYNSGELKEISPELYNLSHTEDGHKNNFYHTLQVLKNVCDMNYSYKMKMVALFHDIGKPKTKRQNSKNVWSFHGHEIVGANMFIELCKKNNISNIDLDYLYRMIKYHGRLKIHRDVTESAIRRLDKEIGQDIIFDLINFSICDITTKYKDKKDRIVSSLNTIKNRIIEVRKLDEYNSWKNPLTGHIIMKLLPNIKGKEIGDIKKKYENDLRNGIIKLDDVINDIKRNYE